MTVTRGFALCFAVVLAGALAGTPGLEADASPTVRLKTITSKVNGKGRYGLDAVVDGMTYARPKIPPTRYDSKVISIDDSAALVYSQAQNACSVGITRCEQQR